MILCLKQMKKLLIIFLARSIFLISLLHVGTSSQEILIWIEFLLLCLFITQCMLPYENYFQDDFQFCFHLHHIISCTVWQVLLPNFVLNVLQNWVMLFFLVPFNNKEIVTYYLFLTIPPMDFSKRLSSSFFGFYCFRACI